MARAHKGQHKIPRTYPQGFTDSNGMVWVGNETLKLFPQKPENILKERDYYTIRFTSGGGTLDVETKFLNGIEGSYADLFRERIKKKSLINEKEKAKMAVFVASMMLRQPLNRDSMRKFFQDVEEHIKHLRGLPDRVKKQMASLPPIPQGKGIPAEEFLEMGKDVGSLHSSMIPDTVRDIAPIIFEMKWCFALRSKGSDVFITSDNPCVLVNPEAEARFGKGTIGAAPGLAQKDVELTLPLSSDIALTCGWKLKMDCVYLPITTKLVDNFNTRTKRHARTIVGSDKKMIEKIIKRIKSHQF